MGRSVFYVLAATLLTENVDGKKQQEKTHILSINIGSMVPSCGDIKSMVPDSFHNDQCENDGKNLRPQVPDAIEADLTTFAQDTCTPETTGLPASVDVLQDRAVGVVETSDVRKNFCHEAHRIRTLNEGHRRGDSIVSYSALGCTALGKKKCVSSEENSVHCPEILYEQKGVTMSSLCVEGIFIMLTFSNYMV